MSRPAESALLAFIGDTLDLDQFDVLRRSEALRLAPARRTREFAHLNGDPDALVAELLRMARIGFLIGLAAHQTPNAPVQAVFAEAERTARRS